MFVNNMRQGSWRLPKNLSATRVFLFFLFLFCCCFYQFPAMYNVLLCSIASQNLELSEFAKLLGRQCHLILILKIRNAVRLVYVLF